MKLLSLFDLTNKIALVTGGGSGLGHAIAIGIAKAGANVAVVTNSSPAQATMEAIQALGRDALSIQADLSVESQLSEVTAKVLERFGRIDILINNAGIIRRKPAAEHEAKDWHDVLSVNLDAVFFLCQLAGREMIKQGSGKIINIASMLSYQGGVNVPGYTASKHAVAGVTKALANEWASKGIQVNAIAPGYMITDNTTQLRQDPVRNGQILERIPAGRWGLPEDLVGPVVMLASAASDYMNGHILCVDGGWQAR